MKAREKLTEALENAGEVERLVKQLIQEVDDYDLERLLKKIDAEFKDLRHNLTIARRLAEGLEQKPEKRKKAKRKSR
jgi:ribosomal protein L12E/L44/L45/RPP1/RPP2